MKFEIMESVSDLTAGSPCQRLSGVLKVFRRIMQVDALALTMHAQDKPILVCHHGYPEEVACVFSSNSFYETFDMQTSSIVVDESFYPTWQSIGWESTSIAQHIMKPAGFRDGSSMPIFDSRSNVVGYLHSNTVAGGSAFQLEAAFADLRDRISESALLVHQLLSSRLTEREIEILRLVTKGYTSKNVGDELFLSPRTVSTHMDNIFKKTGTSNRTQAAVWAIRHGV